MNIPKLDLDSEVDLYDVKRLQDLLCTMTETECGECDDCVFSRRNVLAFVVWLAGVVDKSKAEANLTPVSGPTISSEEDGKQV